MYNKAIEVNTDIVCILFYGFDNSENRGEDLINAVLSVQFITLKDKTEYFVNVFT